MDFKELMEKIDIKYVIVGLTALLLILLVLLLVRSSRKNRFRRQLEGFRIAFTDLKTIPLTFKMNKVTSLAKSDADLNDRLGQFNDSYDQITSNFTTITSMMSSMEDAIETGKLKDCADYAIDLEGLLSSGRKQVNRFDAELDEALQPENERRDLINTCKERFRELRNTYAQNALAFSFSEEAIDAEMNRLEKKFTNFEELMFANDYVKATQCVNEIEQGISKLEEDFRHLGEDISQARGVIPKKIDEISQAFSRIKQKGIYLQHLEVAKNLDLISESLKADLSKIRQLETAGISEHFEDYNTRLSQLMEQMEKEDASYDEMEADLPEVKKHLDNMIYLVNDIDERKDSISVRYNMEDFVSKLPEYQKKNAECLNIYENIAKQWQEKLIPASTILLSLRELDNSVTAQYEELRGMKDELDNNLTTEEGARKQLLKLHLIMNEIQIKIRTYQLPSVSSRYEGDLKDVYKQIHDFEELLNQDVLNTNLLAQVQSDTIDAVYKLYNNVNNVVGMAQMVENTIVFANKYRSSDQTLDSDLTKAELLFRNGEYTQALSIAISGMERLHLDSYEDSIRENAARNTSL